MESSKPSQQLRAPLGAFSRSRMVVTGRGFPLYAFAYCRYILAHYKARDQETNGRACGYVLTSFSLFLSSLSLF